MHASTERNSSNASRGDSQESNRAGRGALKRKREAAYQAAALDGYAGVAFDHCRHGMYTGPVHAAFVVGCWLRETGRSAPLDPRPSRGDLFKVNDLLLRINWCHVKHPVITLEG